MDPQMRKLLEVTHEAFVDSGIDYKALRGSPRVGVYLGCCGSEVRSLERAPAWAGMSAARPPRVPTAPRLSAPVRLCPLQRAPRGSAKQLSAGPDMCTVC